MIEAPPFLILATCDTKGEEGAWIRDRLLSIGLRAHLVDVGVLGDPVVAPDVPAIELIPEWEQIRSLPRGEAVNRMAEGAARWAGAHAHEIRGVLALGGSAGTTIACQVMRSLPPGMPRVMISTLAAGPVEHYVQGHEIHMVDPLVDVAGLNRISRRTFSQALTLLLNLAHLELVLPEDNIPEDRPLVAATMFGVTTACVDEARRLGEERGWEVLVFHATGHGGATMEKFIRDGRIHGVLDFTTTEIADECVGGVLSAGPSRLTAAAEKGVPQVVCPGATDMVNFLSPETVPLTFSSRKFHVHNANVTLMRTTTKECLEIGENIGRKLCPAHATTRCLFPKRGVSALDAPGQPFEDGEARQALYRAWRIHASPTPCLELDLHLNDPSFAKEAVAHLDQLMNTNQHV